MFFIIISALHISGGFSAHHQELIKLYVQPCVLSRFPAVYRWCGWVGTVHLLLLVCTLQQDKLNCSSSQKWLKSLYYFCIRVNFYRPIDINIPFSIFLCRQDVTSECCVTILLGFMSQVCGMWKNPRCISQAPFGHHFSPIVPPLAARGLPRVADARGT